MRIQDLDYLDPNVNKELINIFKVKNQVQSPNFTNNKMSNGYVDNWLQYMKDYRRTFDKLLTKYNSMSDQNDTLVILKLTEINTAISDIKFITTKLEEKI